METTSKNTPSPAEVNVSRAERIFEVVWEDGHRSRFNLNDLRSMCDCANCRDDREKRDRQEQAENARRLPILGAANRADITSVGYVGRYAFGVKWQDGHQSIFTYDYLLISCPCAECAHNRQRIMTDKRGRMNE